MNEQTPIVAVETCAVPGCDGRPPYLRGWCCRHYKSWVRYGDPLRAKRQHGHAGRKRSRVYSCWHNMITRCSDPKNLSYGGRGIRVCERWLAFENFCADMGDPPKGMSLERKDNDGGYGPGNCKWATPLEQANNRRTNRTYLYHGEPHTVSEIARIANMALSSMRWRLNVLGWGAERAVSEPLRRRKGRKII